jgi:tetratricopeptide (TPR) repeat protein
MESQAIEKSAQSPWLYNPWLDLIVGCGAWSAPLLLLTYAAANSSTLTWSVAFYGLALFFNYPHYMATIYRAYHTREDFNRYRIFTVHITGLVLLTLILSHFWFSALPWIFTLYLTLSPWHYSGQNYGLFMMFAKRAGAQPSENQRQALYSAFLLSYLILFLSFHSGPSNDPLFISIGIPSHLSAMLVFPLAIGFIGFATFGLSGLIEQVGWRALLPSLALFSTQFIWFLLPTALSLGERLRIPQSRYSTGVLAVMHSAQYLWITSYYARREAKVGQEIRWRPLAYFGVLICGGIALFIPGPWLASKVFHYDFTASFLIFTALVNLHHFILDGAIWKLRDGRIAALLLDSKNRVTITTSEAGSRTISAFRWLVADSSGARMLRIGTVLALLTLGIIDQARYYMVLHEGSLAYLQRAASMNSFDSSLETRLGRKELEVGQEHEAETALQAAVRVNPAAAVPRNALLKYLTDNRRYGEAYELTLKSLRYAPDDADLLVDHGILASQLSHPQQAVESWKRAMEIDPSQSRAHLYLASEFDREGKPEAAIPDYVIYLDQISRHSNPPPAQETIGVVLRLAQCQIKANHFAEAEGSYNLAQKIAGQTGNSKLEGFAAISHASLAASEGKKAEALRLYQYGLKLDMRLEDPSSEAADWYSFGVFLRDAGYDPRLAYASLLKAELLLKGSAGSLDAGGIPQARLDLEKTLGNKAGEVRRNSQPFLQDALSVGTP